MRPSPPDGAGRATRVGGRAGTGRQLARAVAAAALAVSIGCGGGGSAPVRVVVPTGASFRAAADSLAHAGVIGSSRLFRLYAKVNGSDRAIRPGTYELRPDMSWRDVLDALTSGDAIVATVTIPEGWSLSQIVPVLARRLELPVDSVTAAVGDSALRARLGVPTPTLEGYLFPETYTFSPGTSARDAVTEMVREFEKRWKPEWTAQLDSLGFTRHQLVTLASIVEKEARVPEERPVIAAVYRNRLRDGMLLQADPTVQYARGEHVARVLFKHLEIDSPYNTYRYPGLPPGPIASPGAASLQAAAFPADVPYLYFVAQSGRPPRVPHDVRRTRARDCGDPRRGCVAAEVQRDAAGQHDEPSPLACARQADVELRSCPSAVFRHLNGTACSVPGICGWWPSPTTCTTGATGWWREPWRWCAAAPQWCR